MQEAEDTYIHVGFLPGIDNPSEDISYCDITLPWFLIKDIDECASDNGGCSQTCTNTEGSFECSCGTGYSLAIDGLDCNGMYSIVTWITKLTIIITDVDECQVNNGGCNQTCTNTEGSFKCSCDMGYTLRMNNLSCDGED